MTSRSLTVLDVSGVVLFETCRADGGGARAVARGKKCDGKNRDTRVIERIFVTQGAAARLFTPLASCHGTTCFTHGTSGSVGKCQCVRHTAEKVGDHVVQKTGGVATNKHRRGGR